MSTEEPFAGFIQRQEEKKALEEQLENARLELERAAWIGRLAAQANRPIIQAHDLGNNLHRVVVATVPELDRLCSLLGLSRGERAFVKAAADSAIAGERDEMRTTLGVFADWLDEKGNEQDAARMRKSAESK